MPKLPDADRINTIAGEAHVSPNTVRRYFAPGSPPMQNRTARAIRDAIKRIAERGKAQP
jgi:DNA-binding LacI/PurR family transcriptional regulator